MTKRLLSICILLMTIIAPSLAQVQVDCGDDLQITNGIDIQFPTLDADSSIIVTAIGIDDFDPLIAVFNEQQNGGCDDNNSDADLYEAELPTAGYVAPYINSAQWVFSGSSYMRVIAGEYEANAGEAIIVIEGNRLHGQVDQMQVVINSEMVKSAVPLTIYAMGLENEDGLIVDPVLSLIDDNGVPLRDDSDLPITCDNVSDKEACWGDTFDLSESYTSINGKNFVDGLPESAMLSIPMSEDLDGSLLTFGITRSNDVDGDYVLVIHFGTGNIPVNDGVAQSTTSPTGASLTCEGSEILANGIEVDFPRLDAEYQVIAIASGSSDPALAKLDNDGNGTCYLYTEDSSSYSATLPLASEFDAAFKHVIAPIRGESARLITGVIDDAGGEILLLIDGMEIPENGTSDIVTVMIPESMATDNAQIIVYMLAKDNDLDPQLALVSAEQEILSDSEGNDILCSRSDDPDLCWGEFNDLTDYGIEIADTDLQGIGSDVMLTFSLSEDLAGSAINIMASGVEETAGEYVLAIYLKPE